LKYVLLGIIQGLTEFLPVSSQGHLLIFQRLFHVPTNIALDTVLHLGTALAATVYFRKEIVEMLLFKRKILWFVIIATFFTGLIGLSFKDFFESLFQSFEYVGPFFIVTGVVILLGEWRGRGQRGEGKMTTFDAALIGMAQGISIIPSLSRSAMTISAALARNLERKFAARFSFLVSIPAILGAGLVESKAIIKAGTIGIGFWPLCLGFLAALLSGWLAIKIFMDIIQRMSIRIFAYYVFALGILVLIFLR